MFDPDSRETSKQMDDAEKGSNHMKSNYSIMLVLVKMDEEDVIHQNSEQALTIVWVVEAEYSKAVDVLNNLANQSKNAEFLDDS
jgi:hypothetical protein